MTAAVGRRGRPSRHLSTDEFHHQRARRYRQGRHSAAGYYADAYDLDTFARLVLAPLGPGGDRWYRPRAHDLGTDAVLDEPPMFAPADSVVVVDGSFLQRRELAGLWDEIIYVDTSFAVARARGVARDAEAMGGPDEAGAAYDRRYHAAARLYLDEVDPIAHAGIVIGNDDIAHPQVHRLG